MRIHQNVNQSAVLKEILNPKNIEKNEFNEVLEFKSAFTDAQIVTSQSVVHELIQKFERQEKIVMKNPTISNIGEYKKIIKDILNVASQNFKCEDVTVYSYGGFQKNLSFSKVIDEKLNTVMEDFLNNNKFSLEGLSAMEDIKGLILDIFV